MVGCCFLNHPLYSSVHLLLLFKKMSFPLSSTIPKWTMTSGSLLDMGGPVLHVWELQVHFRDSRRRRSPAQPPLGLWTLTARWNRVFSASHFWALHLSHITDSSLSSSTWGQASDFSVPVFLPTPRKHQSLESLQPKWDLVITFLLLEPSCPSSHI